MKLTTLCLLLLFACHSAQDSSKLAVCSANAALIKATPLSFELLNTVDANSDEYFEIEGYLHFNFEDVALYPGKYATSEEALWLDFDSAFDATHPRLEQLNGEKVRVTGMFNKYEKGHLSGYFGGLKRVVCIKEE